MIWPVGCDSIVHSCAGLAWVMNGAAHDHPISARVVRRVGKRCAAAAVGQGYELYQTAGAMKEDLRTESMDASGRSAIGGGGGRIHNRYRVFPPWEPSSVLCGLCRRLWRVWVKCSTKASFLPCKQTNAFDVGLRPRAWLAPVRTILMHWILTAVGTPSRRSCNDIEIRDWEIFVVALDNEFRHCRRLGMSRGKVLLSDGRTSDNSPWFRLRMNGLH